MIRHAGYSGRKSVAGAKRGQDFKRTAGVFKGEMNVSEKRPQNLA